MGASVKSMPSPTVCHIWGGGGGNQAASQLPFPASVPKPPPPSRTVGLQTPESPPPQPTFATKDPLFDAGFARKVASGGSSAGPPLQAPPPSEVEARGRSARSPGQVKGLWGGEEEALSERSLRPRLTFDDVPDDLDGAAPHVQDLVHPLADLAGGGERRGEMKGSPLGRQEAAGWDEGSGPTGGVAAGKIYTSNQAVPRLNDRH